MFGIENVIPKQVLMSGAIVFDRDLNQPNWQKKMKSGLLDWIQGLSSWFQDVYHQNQKKEEKIKIIRPHTAHYIHDIIIFWR